MVSSRLPISGFSCFVLSQVDLANWLIIFTSRSNSQVAEFVNTYQRCARDMGIRVDHPQLGRIENDRTESYVKEIRDKLTPHCQLVVTIFPSSRDDRYSAVKRVCCADMPVPSQAINLRTISDQRKLRSVTQKIALQINCKLGGELWSVKIPAVSICDKIVFVTPGLLLPMSDEKHWRNSVSMSSVGRSWLFVRCPSQSEQVA